VRSGNRDSKIRLGDGSGEAEALEAGDGGTVDAGEREGDAAEKRSGEIDGIDWRL
jgi:hypothetical protein